MRPERPSAVLVIAAVVAGAASCAPPPADIRSPKRLPQPPIVSGEFVRAEGTGFVLGERPFRFVGANAAMIHGEQKRAGMEALFDALDEDGISVIRVWATGEADDDGREWRADYAFRLGPDGWVESSFVHLDRLLVMARARNIRVMLTLVNRWGDYGGLPHYAGWADIPLRRRNLLSPELARVLRDERVRELYRAHVERVVTRVNSISDVPYRDDPTIMAWELANELSSQSCDSADALLDWTRVMARFVRSLDDHHLIASGHIGYKTELGRAGWLAVNALPEIGFADVHAYPQNVTAVTDQEALGGWLDERAWQARHALDKPLVVGEIGFPRGDRRFEPRAEWFAAALDRAAEDGVAGVMVWIYRPWDERDDPHGVWDEGPHGEASHDVRAQLRWAAVRWAGTRATVTRSAVRDARPAAPLFPLGIEHLRPWVEGEWTVDDEGRGGVDLDPWAFAEGCVSNDEGEAWLLYVADGPDEDVLNEFRADALGPAPEDPSVDLDIAVLSDGQRIGTFSGAGRYDSVDSEALADAFAEPRGFHYLEFRTDNANGRAHLRRVLHESSDADVVRIRGSAPGASDM